MASDPQTEARRLAILQLLQRDPDYSINDDILHKLLIGLNQGVAMSVLHADLAWLERLGLVATTQLPSYTIAMLRGEGVDVACGLSTVPGIARSRPA